MPVVSSGYEGAHARMGVHAVERKQSEQEQVAEGNGEKEELPADWPSCQAISPHRVFTRVPSLFTGLVHGAGPAGSCC
jgi:hypothetical protein